MGLDLTETDILRIYSGSAREMFFSKISSLPNIKSCSSVQSLGIYEDVQSSIAGRCHVVINSYIDLSLPEMGVSHHFASRRDGALKPPRSPPPPPLSCSKAGIISQLTLILSTSTLAGGYESREVNNVDRLYRFLNHRLL